MFGPGESNRLPPVQFLGELGPNYKKGTESTDGRHLLGRVDPLFAQNVDEEYQVVNEYNVHYIQENLGDAARGLTPEWARKTRRRVSSRDNNNYNNER